MVELSLSKHCLPNHLSTTRFHSFIDGNIPSVCDYQFIGEFFTDVFTDGIRPSAFLSSKTQKNHLLMVLQTEFACQKKKFPAWNIPTDFIPSVISWLTDGYVPSVNLSVSVWNTDRIYPSVNSSVIVAATVECRRIHSVGKAVGECMKYWPNISVCKCVGECGSYCQMPTDSFRR